MLAAVSAGLPGALRFYLRHAWRAFFIVPEVADKWSTRASWLIPAIWVVLVAVLPLLGAASNGPSFWIGWSSWNSLLGLAALTYMIAFLRSVWMDYSAVKNERHELRANAIVTEVYVRRRLTVLLDQGEALLTKHGDALTEEQVESFAKELRTILGEAVIHPTWDELCKMIYNKNPYAKSSRPYVWPVYFRVVLNVLAELIGGLGPQHVREQPRRSSG